MIERLWKGWASRRQARDLESFMSILTTMNYDEIGFVAALAAEWRNELKRQIGIDLLQPFVVIAAKPEITYELSSRVQQLQAAGQQSLAAPLMVWVHTLRGASNPSIRNRVREMWSYLEKGFDHMADATITIRQMTGNSPDIAQGDQIPEGFEASKVAKK